MSNRTNPITCKQVNEMDMVDYLASLGYWPVKVSHNDYWYISPLRDEKTASFKVNRQNNVWYDHGLGKGGKVVDFGIIYHHCTVQALLARFDQSISIQQPLVKMIAPAQETFHQTIKIIGEKDFHSPNILHYLHQRRIPENIATKYCRELEFELNEKKYNAVGFKNDAGGFEIRNQWFKASSSPKSMTTIINHSENLAAFEGFFNFLSYQTIQQNQPPNSSDYLILNSAAFSEKAKPIIDDYQCVNLFLDNDNTGHRITVALLAYSKKCKDQRELYKGYNDLNEWMQHIGKSQKRRLKPFH